MCERTPALYGICNSNRTGDPSNRNNYWGKNQFNSAFPVSLACYMRDQGIPAVYLCLNEQLQVERTEISIEDVFNSTQTNRDLRFDFESKYAPYQQYSYDDISHIDLVIKHQDEWLRALEIKLTVLPDSSTHNQNENRWGTELVIRPVTTWYGALGMAFSCNDNLARIREIMEPACHRIRQWENQHEVSANKFVLLSALSTFQREFHKRQQPFLLQPIWKTRGRTPILDENAFDIFVWSDFALCRTFLDRSVADRNVDRYMRSTVRLARMLYDISTRGLANIRTIYTEGSFEHQNDKEFALSGVVTRDYMSSPRLTTPIIPRDALKEIILGGGYRLLSPERRFDQTVYFGAAELFLPEFRS